MANVNLKKDFVNGDKLYDYQLNNNFAAIEAALAAMNKIVWQDDEENGAGVSAYKGDTDAIEDRELIDGQLLYNTETGETYIDTYIDNVLIRINTGSGNVVAIQDTEPTNDAVKLWIETDTLDALNSEVINEESNSTKLAYSADYVNKELYYQPGDTYETTDYRMTYAGHISSGTKNIFFTVPLPKRLDKISSITVNKLTLAIRTPAGGYVVETDTDFLTDSNVSSISTFKEGNCLIVAIYGTNAWTNATNNTPLSIAPTDFKVTFNEESEES